jgi:hypothetical protein
VGKLYGCEPYYYSTIEFQDYLEYIDSEISQSEIDLEGLENYCIVKDQGLEGFDRCQKIVLKIVLKILQAKEDLEVLIDYIQDQDKKVLVSIIQPMFHEVKRMSPRSEKNPYGENALVEKLELCKKYAALSENLSFRFVNIDDGCEQGSAKMAKKICRKWKKENPDARVGCRVEDLRDAIADEEFSEVLNIRDTKQSVKGGSIIYGMYLAKQYEKQDKKRGVRYDQHIVVDSDFDLSVSSYYIPSLILPIIRNKTKVVASSRRLANSVTCSNESRNKRSKIFRFYTMQFLPTLTGSDPNRGFKAFDSSVLDEFIKDVKERTFPYQIELLVYAQKYLGGFKQIAISFVDSEELSNQTSDPEQMSQGYFNQLKKVYNISKRYGYLDQGNPKIKSIIDLLQQKASESDLEQLLD